jgi:Glycosyltransferase Family 4
MSPSRRRRANEAWVGRPTISVATLPGRGLYARHLGHPEGVDAVYRPTVGSSDTPMRGASFTPLWLRTHLDEVDVVHVQGLSSCQDPAQVSAAVEIVRGSGTPLVVTGYHLTDPTGSDPQRYAAQLDALVPQADAVITLTTTAAEEMRHRWDVEATVVPHPHVVNFVRMRRRRRPRHGRLRVGTHLATLNVGMDPVLLVDALTRAAAGIEDTQLVVHAHETVLDPGSSTYAPATIRAIHRLIRSAGGTLRLHRPFSDSQLWDHLSSLDVSLVPVLHGSHSIWPEACTDLGTRTLMPAGTHAAAQQPCLTYSPYTSVEALADELAKALLTAHEQQGALTADPERRWTERVRAAETLRAVYEPLLGLDHDQRRALSLS